MQLFYSENISEPLFTLDEQESNHIIRVLRLGIGCSVFVTDGVGTIFETKIVEPNPKRCVVEIVGREQGVGRRDYQLTMGVAPTKSVDRYEWFLEKATEVGCDRFIPIESYHSERRVLKSDRAERVIVGAMKQSVKSYKPQHDQMMKFEKLVGIDFQGIKLIAHCDRSRGRIRIQDAVGEGSNILILVGPEGDFSREEIELAATNGFREITLGESRLRTETAALTCVMAVALRR